MKKFREYTDFVEKKRKDQEAENKKWETEEDKQSFFFSRNIIPALEDISDENNGFKYELKGTKILPTGITQSYDLILDDKYGLPHGRYHLSVKLHIYEKFDNLELKITNYHSDKEVESFKNYEEMTPELVEHSLTQLMMTLYEKEQE